MRPAHVLLVLLLVAAAASTAALLFVTGSEPGAERQGALESVAAGREDSRLDAAGDAKTGAGSPQAPGRAPTDRTDGGRKRVDDLAAAAGADASDPAALASGRARGRVSLAAGVTSPARYELVVEAQGGPSDPGVTLPPRVFAFEGDVRLVTLDLPAGRSVLRARAEGLGSRPVVVEREEGRPVKPFELTLEPAGALRGQVLDAAGEPVAGLPVHLLPVHAAGGVREAGAVATDAGGRFEFDNLPVGAYQVALGAAASPLAPPVQASVAAGGKQDVEVPRLAELGEAEVLVRDGRGAPVAGVRVTGRGQFGGAFDAVTDADGRVRARFLPLGPTYVDAIDAAGRRASALLEVERGRLASATIRVPGN